jgi:hypothetical protein
MWVAGGELSLIGVMPGFNPQYRGEDICYFPGREKQMLTNISSD